MSESMTSVLHAAIAKRAPLFTGSRDSAFRLYNGFTEGLPELALDVYGTTLVINDYSEEGDEDAGKNVADIVCAELPWVTTVLYKVRNAKEPAARNGRLLRGDAKLVTKKIKENGVKYALQLMLNRDASLYLDTRNLRVWAKEMLADKKVLNAFAYTGSLGVAARAAPAAQVVQTDRDRDFLFVSKDSYAMNGFPIVKADYRIGDFFAVVAQLKRDNALFDCVMLDPPFFAQSDRGAGSGGKIDIEQDMESLINKVRPLVGDGGWLVVVNNGLFVSGADYHAMLTRVCESGYASIDKLIAVPDDFIGERGEWPTDPAPFNHPTKIAVLKMRRKDGRTA